jgi:hypothetical protein
MVLKLQQDICDALNDLPACLWIEQRYLSPSPDNFGDPRRVGGEASIFRSELTRDDGLISVMARRLEPSLTPGDTRAVRCQLHLHPNLVIRSLRQAVRREVIAQRRLNHDNILKMLGVSEDSYRNISIILPEMKWEATEYLKIRRDGGVFLDAVSIELLAKRRLRSNLLLDNRHPQRH